MFELDQLEKNHQAFADRKVRIIAISDDNQATTQETQGLFPHLMIVSDPLQSIAKAAEVTHPSMKPGGGDTNAPTTFLVDDKGYVRWWFRPERYIERASPEQLLAAIDETLKPLD